MIQCPTACPKHAHPERWDPARSLRNTHGVLLLFDKIMDGIETFEERKRIARDVYGVEIVR